MHLGTPVERGSWIGIGRPHATGLDMAPIYAMRHKVITHLSGSLLAEALIVRCLSAFIGICSYSHISARSLCLSGDLIQVGIFSDIRSVQRKQVNCILVFTHYDLRTVIGSIRSGICLCSRSCIRI